MKKWVAAATAALAVAGWCGSASAHALLAKDREAQEARVVLFDYSTGGTANYAEVKVYGPDNDDVEFQNGRTDAVGRFAFVPDKPGTWTLVVADGMGHRVSHPVAVSLSGAAAEETGKDIGLMASSQALRTVLGVSLLLNLFLTVAFFRRRRA